MKKKLFNQIERVAIVATIMLIGCTDSIQSNHLNDDTEDAGTGQDGDTSDGSTIGSSKVETINNGDETFTTIIDAADQSSFVYFDFESATEIELTEQANSVAWDLSFQRFKILSNGGVSGTGGVVVAILSNQDFDTLTEAPETDYYEDAVDGDDENTDIDSAFLIDEGWYEYNSATHALTPKENIYVIKTVEQSYYKFQILDYYDEFGTSGYLKFRWAALAAPSDNQSTDTLAVDASATDSWTYVNVSSGVVSETTPEDSSSWDIAFSRTKIRTNSGTSGTGIGGAKLGIGLYDDTHSASTVGFYEDTTLSDYTGDFSGNSALVNWYDYDSTTHVVTPKDVFYLIRSSTGQYAKMKIMSYASGVYNVELVSISRAVETQSTTIDASDSAAWVYYSFRLGEFVAITDATVDTTWDIGISRTKIRTNSGTSGYAMGGAAELSATALSDVSEALSDGYEIDEIISSEMSWNPVLNSWYNYDYTTHVVSPKDIVFVVRNADGSFVKIKITSYSSGIISFDWAYSGTGQTSF